MFNKLKKLFRKKSDERTRVIVFGSMLLAGLVGLFASFELILDKFKLDANPDAVLSCSINIVLNCSTVMQTWQSELLGFPNMVIGLIAFPVIITYALASMVGVKFPRWWMIAATIGFFIDFVFSYWLFQQSVYDIQVLCPWCLLVTTASTVIFATSLFYNLKQNVFNFKKKTNAKIQRFIDGGHFQMITISWIVLMIVLVFLKFGDALFA
jgi:uncharacterized membrane protein